METSNALSNGSVWFLKYAEQCREVQQSCSYTADGFGIKASKASADNSTAP